MNIFASHPKPRVSALWLDDLRKNKMIIESAQLLSGALRWHGITDARLYALSHQHHPCAKWARDNRLNFIWLLQHLVHLKCQWGAPHKSAELIPLFYALAPAIPLAPQTPFPDCTGGSEGIDIHHAYRACLSRKWREDKRPPTWNRGQRPAWAAIHIKTRE